MTTSSTLSSMLSGLVSSAIIRAIERVGPSVVQVRNGPHGGAAGVIWDAGGSVLTNNHVVAHPSEKDGSVQVLLVDGRRFDARVASANPALDLALLSVAASDLPAAPVGDSSGLRVGELVFAIGHPWGQRGVVTAGVVSGVGEIHLPPNGRTAQYIRSDVRLRPGNSGGPLVNAAGEVVGINAMIFGGDLGVAIPSHVANTWLAGLSGRRMVLGIHVQPVELPHVSRQERWAGPALGLMVIAVNPGGLADRAGVLIGDVLLAVGGTQVGSFTALQEALLQHAAMGTMQLRVLRGGAVMAIDASLEGEAERAA